MTGRKAETSRLSIALLGWLLSLGLLPGAALAGSGSPDPTFAGDGTVVTTLGAYSEAGRALAVQPDGRLVVAGEERLARFLADGRPDPSYGTEGVVAYPAEPDRAGEMDVALQADGKAVVVGRRLSDVDRYRYSFVVMRFNADGSVDRTFGQTGVVETEIGWGNAVSVQPDGRIVVAGRRNDVDGTTSQDDGFAVARYLPDGTLDSTFGDGGTVLTTGGTTAGDTEVQLALQQDGKAVLVGSGYRNGYCLSLVRLLADGRLDPTFAGDGDVCTHVPHEAAVGKQLAVLDDGRLLAVGAAGGTLLARYTPQGILDPTFGGGDGLVIDKSSGGAHELALQGDGRFYTSAGFQPVRYLPDGARDLSFGENGQAPFPFTENDSGRAEDLVLQSDGKPVAVGWMIYGGRSRVGIARYLIGDDGPADGSPPAEQPESDPQTGDPRQSEPEPGPQEGISPQPAPADRAPSPPANEQLSPTLEPTLMHPAKLAVARTRVLRGDRALDVLAPITRRASGQVRVDFHAAGRHTTFTAPVDAENGRVRSRHRIAHAQARRGTGIVTLLYPGDADTRGQIVRLRAASRPAELGVRRPTLRNGRVQASGTISRRARGVVRVQLSWANDGQDHLLELKARVRNGRWRLDERLSDGVLAQIARRTGTLHSYTLFTGYLPARMRGEMRAYQVLPSR